MKNKLIRVMGITAVMALGLTGCAGGSPSDVGGDDGATVDYGVVPIYTPRQGGTAYIIGGGIANLMSKNVDGVQASVEATTGTQEMVQRLEERRVNGQPAFTVMDSAGTQAAYEGRDPYETENTELRALSFVHAADLYMVTKTDSGIDTYADLEGKKVGVGGPGSPTNILSTQIMAAHGVKEGDFQAEFLGYEDVVNGLSNGSIDAGVLAGSYPVSAFTELGAQQDIKILPVDKDVLEAMVEESPFFYATEVEAGAYDDITKDVPILGFGVILVTHADTPDDLVTSMMETIFGNHEQLVKVHGAAAEMTPENASRGIGIPFHPAAVKFLKDSGVEVE